MPAGEEGGITHTAKGDNHGEDKCCSRISRDKINHGDTRHVRNQGRQIVLAARPQGKPRLTDFRLEETAIPTAGPGQVLLRVQFLSLDPYMRERMNARESYQSRSRSAMSCPASRWPL